VLVITLFFTSMFFSNIKGNSADDDNSITSVDAVGLGDASLYEAYFVCITISGQRTLIEYGKSKGTRDTGNVYLTMIDKNRDFEVQFYAFGNKNEAAKIMDAHIVSRKRTQITCKGSTVKDAQENLCGQGCHRTCDPFEGSALFYYQGFILNNWCFVRPRITIVFASSLTLTLKSFVSILLKQNIKKIQTSIY